MPAGKGVLLASFEDPFGNLLGLRDPQAEAEKFTPYMPVRNVTSEYPPTILIHGTHDTDVPYQQSLLLAEQLTRISHRPS